VGNRPSWHQVVWSGENPRKPRQKRDSGTEQPERQRSTRNQRWSRWKTWLPSAADLNRRAAGGVLDSTAVFEFCATSFDDSGGHVQPGASQKHLITRRSSQLVITKSIMVPSTLLLRGTECRVDKDAIVSRAPKTMSDHLTAVIAVLQHQRFQSLFKLSSLRVRRRQRSQARSDWSSG